MSRTHKGLVRPHNEDAVLIDEEHGLVVVADGIGGANAGEIASQLAADVIASRVREESPSCSDPDAARVFLEAAVRQANRRIWEAGEAESACRGMGTTVVVGYVGDDWLAYAHVGDSRLYRLRGDEIHQITRDHSFIQDVVDRGFFGSLAEARRYGVAQNLLTRALGSTADTEVSVGIEGVEEGDIYLFCTDGLSNMVPDDWLRKLLGGVGDDLTGLADVLVTLACERGGTDNITLALLRVGARL
ncbi:PP2C family protein-serine/threonine phosphatase [Thioflavicoccus mobilis]|uniref:PP2C family protein-serine/threonine phosphatase n=1 Tax=Thioflavicoccus mobilis TaxID=80679 RepID=UPI0002EB210D|nr:protein phosphatase 2C domain-containing protein [Thioflavicoccus mobilis]